MQRKPILIVDDDATNLAALRQVLEAEHPLAFAQSGAMALEAARRIQPSLILLDVQMPDLDGLEVCRRLKADPALEAIPVIFVTSLSDAWDEALGFAVGGVDYITKPISQAVVQARVKTHLSLVRTHRLEKSYRDAISMLGAAGHFNDTDTGVHIWRMAAYARTLAEAAGWSPEDCRLLEMAAPMHDTGKIGVPGHILSKAGPLDAAEWAVMKTHPQMGYDILSESDAPVFRMAAEIALRHHEKWDGSGYPGGLAGDAIPESARIVAIADVFDALTMKRSYKEAWGVDEAVQHIRAGAGQHFDPRLVALFEQHLPELMTVRAQWAAREAPGD